MLRELLAPTAVRLCPRCLRAPLTAWAKSRKAEGPHHQLWQATLPPYEAVARYHAK